ncbi:uncharacterized protein LOC126773419 [Nymphalis io]|uniref:uncharacterized protein LOC126773419 n=1 Tax=Inachis io TaxID=171585 RepID=UPI0021683548|nr:uncharacterized protein LOC126773419 [Nymphalis io]
MDNNLLQSQIHESCKLSLPEGLKDLMSDISREVLRAQPQNLYQFIANYLEALLEVRDVLSIAYDICTDTCECTCEPELHSELKAIGLDQNNLDKAVEIIGTHLKNESVNEPSLLAKLVNKTSIDELYIPAIQGAVQRAFKRQQLKNTKVKYSQNDPNDKTTNAVQHTIKLYQQRKPKSKQLFAQTALKSCIELKSGDSSGDFDKASFQEQDQSINNNVGKELLNTNDNDLENDRNYDLYYPKYIIEDEDIEEEIVEHEKSRKNSIVSSVDESLANADDSDDGSM